MVSLKEAAMGGWEVCQGCQLVFCGSCKKSAKDQEFCPGSVYTVKHESLFQLLPVEQILETAHGIDRPEKTGSYISKIFFDDEKKKIELLKKDKKKKEPIDFSVYRFREEQWRKFGTVLVKRKDGKFLTWGQFE
jgi:hypothetical protein